MKWRRTRWLAVLLGTALLVGAGGASLASAAAPSTVTIQAIGKGQVSGSGLDCGLGYLGCYASYASSGSITITATAPAGWAFDKWTDDASGCLTATCTLALAPGNQTATAVFKTSAPTAVPSQSFAVSLAGQGTVTNDTHATSAYPVDCSQTGPGPTTTGPCSVTVFQGSTITVLETPDTFYIFSGWGGACSGTGPSCSVYLNSDKTASANFASASAHTLSVVVDGSGTVNGGGITCNAGSTCDAQEPPNATVTLTATPQSGYAFTGWSGACAGTQTTCTVTMDADRSVTANFDPLVPVVISVNGAGTVSGAGVTCGPGPTTCTGSATPNTSVLLTATPPAGGSVAWTGCSSTAGTICRITVSTTPVSVTANFGAGTGPPPTVALTVNVNGDGYVMSTGGTTAIYCTAAGGSGCSTSVQQGTSVTLKAVPASGATADFTGWDDDCAAFTSTTCTLTMSSAKVATANFVGGNTTYTLSGTVDGSGSISGGGLHCTAGGGSGCSSPQAAGATVTLSAQPSFGATFTGWGGACSGTSTSCNVAMSSAKNVTATFKQSAPGKQLFSIMVAGKGSVKGSAGTCTSKTAKGTTCVQEYADAEKVTLTATPAAGWAFDGWKGACTGGKPTCTVTMVAALATTATFVQLPLAPGHTPTVARTKVGYRITLYYIASVAGTVRLVGTRGTTTVVSRTKAIGTGSGKLLVTVQQKGAYRFTLSLTVKHKTTRVVWTVKV